MKAVKHGRFRLKTKYITKQNWPNDAEFSQCGTCARPGNIKFFEIFLPGETIKLEKGWERNIKGYYRGEGASIEEAEEQCYLEYIKDYPLEGGDDNLHEINVD